MFSHGGSTAAHVKMRSSCEFRNRPPLSVEMKHVVLRKGGTYLEEESHSLNSPRMGNTSRRASTSVYQRKRHNVCF